MSENMEKIAEPTPRSAIAGLKERAKRIRVKGIGLLAGAGIAAVSCAIAFTVYLNTDPASGFTDIDLPTVAKSVIEPLPKSSTSSLSEVSGSPIQTAATSLTEVVSSPIWKVLGFVGLLVFGLVFVSGGSVNIGAIIGLIGFVFVVPSILSSLLSGESGEVAQKTTPPAAANFIKQLVDEKRYAELAEVSSAMLPKGQAAYVNAQIAYISQRKEAAQAELGQLNASSLAGWTPNWGRISTMEKYAFGSQRLPQSQQYATEVKQKADSTYSTVTMLAGATMILAIPGIALFGFGNSMRKRANRLESMLGVQDDQGQVLLTTSEPVRLTPKDSGWVPAWQRPVEAKSERNSRNRSDSSALGVAAATVAVASMDSSSPTCDAASSAGADGGCI